MHNTCTVQRRESDTWRYRISSGCNLAETASLAGTVIVVRDHEGQNVQKLHRAAVVLYDGACL